MSEIYKLDKTLAEGTIYTTPPDRGFVIRKLGTDSVTGCNIVIDGTLTGDLVAGVAPIRSLPANLLGPLDLEDLYYVIPPDKQFYLSGGGTDLMRIIGQIVKLATGEAFPADLLARYNAQGKHYLQFDEESVLYGVNTAWPANQAIAVYSVTPVTSETFVYRKYLGVEYGTAGLTEGQVGVVLKLDGAPLDLLTSVPAPLGIDALSMPRPPATTTEQEPFSLADRPITVNGDHTISVELVNISGGALTILAATDQYVTTVVEVVKA